MLTELLRDHSSTIAWFGLMAFVWFGWGQEDPPPAWRWRLVLGSGVGLVLVAVFGVSVARAWRTESALDGRYHWFGLLVLAEVVLAGLGCWLLFSRGQSRWMAWWVAMIVALHFVPLAILLDDWSLAALGLGQAIVLRFLRRRLAERDYPTSRLVGPVMGGSLVAFALVSAVVFLGRHGSPW